MADTLNLDETDEALAEVVIDGQPFTLDLWRAWGKITEICTAHAGAKNNSEPYCEDVLKAMEQLGLPRVSYHRASRFAAWLLEQAAKKNEPDAAAGEDSRPDSPASMAAEACP